MKHKTHQWTIYCKGSWQNSLFQLNLIEKIEEQVIFSIKYTLDCHNTVLTSNSCIIILHLHKIIKKRYLIVMRFHISYKFQQYQIIFYQDLLINEFFGEMFKILKPFSNRLFNYCSIWTKWNEASSNFRWTSVSQESSDWKMYALGMRTVLSIQMFG